MAFLGIGVVDPVLPTIASSMGASHFMVELLFTSYLLVMAAAMFVSGALATRIGSKNTLVVGLGLVAIFAGLCGFAPSLEALALLRGGWDLGNALFTTTALRLLLEVRLVILLVLSLYLRHLLDWGSRLGHSSVDFSVLNRGNFPSSALHS